MKLFLVVVQNKDSLQSFYFKHKDEVKLNYQLRKLGLTIISSEEINNAKISDKP